MATYWSIYPALSYSSRVTEADEQPPAVWVWYWPYSPVWREELAVCHWGHWGHFSPWWIFWQEYSNVVLITEEMCLWLCRSDKYKKTVLLGEVITHYSFLSWLTNHPAKHLRMSLETAIKRPTLTLLPGSTVCLFIYLFTIWCLSDSFGSNPTELLQWLYSSSTNHSHPIL